MNNLEHSYKGTSWKKGHKYLYKKNGRYYYKNNKNNNESNTDYNWLEDWWGIDEEDRLREAAVIKNLMKEQKESSDFDYSYKKILADSLPDSYSNKKELQQKVTNNYRKANKAYMQAIKNFNEKKAAYEKTPKGKFNNFIDKGKTFVNNLFKKKK